jgi:hypothetical protein
MYIVLNKERQSGGSVFTLSLGRGIPKGSAEYQEKQRTNAENACLAIPEVKALLDAKTVDEATEALEKFTGDKKPAGEKKVIFYKSESDRVRSTELNFGSFLAAPRKRDITAQQVIELINVPARKCTIM